MDNPTVKKNDLARLDITESIKRRLKKLTSHSYILYIVFLLLLLLLLLEYR